MIEYRVRDMLLLLLNKSKKNVFTYYKANSFHLDCRVILTNPINESSS